ncbi:MAG: hypothetical protein R2568_00185 [Candidatus Scalindua sp.]|nr:hypothetical protein [Candidatus Scalindua sp.]MDV5165150.1 hypothetical protein [Candidatus Scalindua sp.]
MDFKFGVVLCDMFSELLVGHGAVEFSINGYGTLNKFSLFVFLIFSFAAVFLFSEIS